MNLYLFLFSFISCASFLKENYEVIQGIYHVMLKIESINLINYMEIDLSIGFLWISDLNFEEKDLESTSLIATETVQLSNGIMYLAKLLKGKISLDFNEISMTDFYMYYLKRDEYKIYDSVGFAFKVDYEKSSFLHQLYNHQLIDKLLFAFVPNKRFYNSGEIFYGGIPDEKIKDKYSTHCNVTEHWGCTLQGITIGNKKKIELDEKYIHFETQYQQIFLRKNIIDTIVNEYFSDYIKKQQCYVNNDRYFCPCSYIDSFQNISFTLDNHEFIFTGHELFEQEGMNCYFIILENKKSYYDIFGTYFLRKYITIFDYENKTVSFYNDEPFNEYQSVKKGNNIIKVMYTFISISLIISTIILLYINKKYKY